MKKGKLIKSGIGMAAMLDFCFVNKLSDANSILDVDVKSDEWEIYEKILAS